MLSLALAASLASAAVEPSRDRPLATAAAPSAQSLVAEMEVLAAAQAGEHPLEARELDARLAAFGPRLEALGPRALPLLSWYLGRKERPLKVRLYAAAVLGLIGDPSSLRPLRHAAEDASEDPGLRAAATQALGSLRLAPHEVRPLLDGLLSGTPDPVLREALVRLAFVGTDRPEAVLAAAKTFGPRPARAGRAAAEAAADALALSPGSAADGVLVELLRFWRPGDGPRGRALAALSRRRAAGRPFAPSRTQLDFLAGLPFSEEGPAALSAARLLGLSGDRRAVGPLTRLLKAAPTAALAAEAAQALAALGDPAARGPVEALAAGLARDPRFGAREGQPDPKPAAAAVEAAARALAGAPEKTMKGDLPFLYAGWPGSGTPKVLLSGDGALTLRSRPEAGAPPAARQAGKGGLPLPLAGSVVVARRPGWSRARAALELDARSFGSPARVERSQVEGPAPRAPLPLRLGELVETLLPLGAGQCLVRKDGAVFEAPCPELDRERFDVVGESVSEWWLELDAPAGRGWASADDPALTILRD